MSFSLTKCFELRCTHELLSEVNEPKHGHNYTIEVTLANNELDTNCHWLYSRDKFNTIIEDEIIKVYDKSLLNRHFKFTSGEYLVEQFFEKLLKTELGHLLKSVAIQETNKNRFVRVR